MSREMFVVHSNVCSYQQVDVFLLKSHGNVHSSCERACVHSLVCAAAKAICNQKNEAQWNFIHQKEKLI